MSLVADKIEVSSEQVAEQKQSSWWYKRAFGGGSLLDYLGYGVTLGAWCRGGRAQSEVTTIVDLPAGLEVDQHSITICRYEDGLSKFETPWATFTDPLRGSASASSTPRASAAEKRTVGLAP